MLTANLAMFKAILDLKVLKECCNGYWGLVLITSKDFFLFCNFWDLIGTFNSCDYISVIQV